MLVERVRCAFQVAHGAEVFSSAARRQRRFCRLVCFLERLRSVFPGSGRPFPIFGNHFRMFGSLFGTYGNHFPILGSLFGIFGNHFRILRSIFGTFGNYFLTLGSLFGILGNHFLTLGSPFGLLGNHFPTLENAVPMSQTLPRYPGDFSRRTGRSAAQFSGGSFLPRESQMRSVFATSRPCSQAMSRVQESV